MNTVKVFKTEDPVGTIILEKNRVYRGIKSEYSAKMTEIIKRCENANLFGQFIQNTKIVPNKKFEGFDIILEHEKIDPFIYPGEFSTAMIYDAANMVLDLMFELEKIGLVIKDPHIFNLTFYRGKFLWVDIGGLTFQDEPYDFRCGFRDAYINTLIFSSQGNWRKMSAILKAGMFLKKQDVFGRLRYRQKFQYIFYDSLVRQCFKKKNIKRGLNVLKRWLESLKPTMNKARWSEYHSNRLQAYIKGAPLDDHKAEQIISFMKEIKPNRIFDIGGNAGYYSYLAAEYGIKSIVCDIEEESINQAYSFIKKVKSTLITTVVMNFLSPTPSFFHAAPCEDDGCIDLREFSAKKGFKSDLVLALALIHHLVFYQRVNFGEIVRQLKSFSSKYLIVEFPHAHDEHVSKWETERFPWYTIENFEKELNVYFNIIKKVNILRDERTLLFCSLKEFNSQN